MVLGQEVFDFLADHLSLIERPSFRHYLAAAELKRGGLLGVKGRSDDSSMASSWWSLN